MRRAAAVVAPLDLALPRRERWHHARAAAGEALRASGALAGAPSTLPYGAWPRDADGAPSEIDGWHASLADTTGLVVALVAPFPAAVDVEWLARPRWHAARARFAAEGELALLVGEDREHVLALWTAKEALLKLARRGLADLGRCALVERRDEGFLLRHNGAEHVVRVLRHGEHVLALAAREPCALELHEPAELSLEHTAP